MIFCEILQYYAMQFYIEYHSSEETQAPLLEFKRTELYDADHNRDNLR